MTAQRAEVLDSAYIRDRAVMVERHLKARGISDPLLLTAMGTVPRETFVAEHLQEFAYEDSALPIEAGQTISQPYIVARMLELAEIKPGDKVLEIGAGSGYAAAVISRMANKVFAVEPRARPHHCRFVTPRSSRTRCLPVSSRRASRLACARRKQVSPWRAPMLTCNKQAWTRRRQSA